MAASTAIATIIDRSVNLTRGRRMACSLVPLSRIRTISAPLPRVTESRTEVPQCRPFTRSGINVPSPRSTAEFWDGPPLALFFVRLLREGRAQLDQDVVGARRH